MLTQFGEEQFKEAVTKQGYSFDSYLENIVKKITTCVYDHLAMEEEYIKIYRQYCKRYIVCSKKLYAFTLL